MGVQRDSKKKEALMIYCVYWGFPSQNSFSKYRWAEAKVPAEELYIQQERMTNNQNRAVSPRSTAGHRTDLLLNRNCRSFKAALALGDQRQAMAVLSGRDLGNCTASQACHTAQLEAALQNTSWSMTSQGRIKHSSCGSHTSETPWGSSTLTNADTKCQGQMKSAWGWGDLGSASKSSGNTMRTKQLAVN